MGIKYILEHNSPKGQIHKTTIEIPSYDGEVIYLDGVEKTSTQLQWNGDENPFDKHVIGSQLTLNVYDTGNIDLDELMLTPDLEYRVKYYIDNELFWSGFLISDGIQEQLSYRPSIQLTAVDGMLGMEGLDISITNPQSIDMGSYESVIRCPLNMLRQCFNTIGNNLPINWMCKTKNSSYIDADVLAGSVSWSPRGEILIMKKMDCYEIFEGILKSFNLHCFQAYGEWWIVNYQDLIASNNNFNGYRIESFDLRTVETKELDVTIQLKDVLNQGVRMLNKPISKVKVTYNATRDENIVPNGSMNLVDVVNQSVIYWYGNINNVYQNKIHDGFSGRSTDKYGNKDKALEFVTQVPTGITFHDGSKVGIPFDAKTLFPRFTLGLSVLPYNFPTYTSGEKQGQIAWIEKQPLQLEVTYKTQDKLWYLNENGYWIEEGLEQLVVERYKYTRYGVRVWFKGKIAKGQLMGIGKTEWQYYESRVFTRFADSLEDSLNMIVEAWSDSVRFGVFRENDYLVFESPLPTLSDVSPQISTRISLIAENSMNEEVVRFQFTSKGGESRIKIPEPENLDSQDIGILKYYIHHNGAYKSAIDDVYINIDENYDVYEASIPSKKDSVEEYEMTISSSFSGFLLSSYMNSWADCHTTMKYTRFGIDATLTEHYARDVIRMKSKPYQKIDQTYLGMVTPLNVMNGNMVASADCTYSAHENQTKVTLIEYKLNDVQDLNVRHYGSNDDNIS